MPDTQRYKMRRGNLPAATKRNEVLENGELFFDKLTGNYIVGDGQRTWAQLKRPMAKQPLSNAVRSAVNIHNYTNLSGGL